MIVAGIDIGSRAAKVVIMEDDSIKSSAIIDTGSESTKTAYAAVRTALCGTGLGLENIDYTVATGYGRVLVPFASENISEISCHARGITWYFPTVRTILDMGGQDCKAINCDSSGLVEDFVMNDKCAGGTGRFLEMIAEVLGVPLEECGELSLQSRNPVVFNTVCAVFAKSDAIKYLRSGTAKGDILAGLHEAIATRATRLLKRVNLQVDFAITGGISKNSGMVEKITRKAGLEPLLCPDPQLAGALGAALFARERYSSNTIIPRKVHYGYSDGTGEYFIAIDYNKCDDCSECIKGCPAGIFSQGSGTAGQPAIIIKQETARRLSSLCRGKSSCNSEKGTSCQDFCPQKAINLSW